MEKSFNPDSIKQAQEVIFFSKNDQAVTLELINSLTWFLFQNASSQEHPGMILDEKLTFQSHLKEKCLKFNKSNGVTKKLQNILL